MCHQHPVPRADVPPHSPTHTPWHTLPPQRFIDRGGWCCGANGRTLLCVAWESGTTTVFQEILGPSCRGTKVGAPTQNPTGRSGSPSTAEKAAIVLMPRRCLPRRHCEGWASSCSRRHRTRCRAVADLPMVGAPPWQTPSLTLANANVCCARWLRTPELLSIMPCVPLLSNCSLFGDPLWCGEGRGWRIRGRAPPLIEEVDGRG